jgi:hypothetical protein
MVGTLGAQCNRKWRVGQKLFFLRAAQVNLKAGKGLSRKAGFGRNPSPSALRRKRLDTAAAVNIMRSF